MDNSSWFKDWDSSHTDLFGNHAMLLNHRLVESGLFSKTALAEVIEKLPADHYNLNTMGYDYDNPEWREGQLGEHSGRDVIAAIDKGRMWLNIRRLQDVDNRYARLLDSVMDEFEDKMPGFEAFKRDMGVLISSPKVRVFYHADVPGQALWQISGRKRLYVYPNSEPFLKPADMEKIVLGMKEEELPYREWFDEHATIYDLEPGEMVHWPLNGPHQVINEDSLNISVTTSHWTKQIRNAYAVNYANGVLRNTFGYTPKSTEPVGASVYPKAALALMWKKLKLQKAQQFVRRIDFQIDPAASGGLTDLAVPMVK